MDGGSGSGGVLLRISDLTIHPDHHVSPPPGELGELTRTLGERLSGSANILFLLRLIFVQWPETVSMMLFA